MGTILKIVIYAAMEEHSKYPKIASMSICGAQSRAIASKIKTRPLLNKHIPESGKIPTANAQLSNEG